MKAWALWQPWASLWLRCKVHETRSRPFHYRGWLLVHATKHIEHDVDDDLTDIVDSEFGGHWGMELPLGALIGAVEIVGCRPTEDVFPQAHSDVALPEGARRDDYICGNFTPGRFAIERAEVVKVFRDPIPFRGQQTLFDVPDDLVSEALETAMQIGNGDAR